MRTKILTGLIVLLLCIGCEPGPPTPRVSEPLPLIASIQDDIAAADPTAESYYASTYRWEEPRYWSRIAGWMVEDAIGRQYLEDRVADRVLDLGCGYGTLLAFATVIYGAPGLCYDVVPYLQPAVRSRYGIAYEKRDIEREPFPPDLEVDVVLMTEVIEHLNFHPRHTLVKVYAALRPGGVFFLSTPDADHGWGRVYDYYERLDDIPAPDLNADWIDGHIWQYTETEIRQVLEEAGFVIERLEHAPGSVGLHFNIRAIKPDPERRPPG